MADLQKDDEKKFNETVQRMLKTPPKHHSDSNPTPTKREHIKRTLGAQKSTDKNHE
ncbi:hypothetical protein NKI12_03325 [Mesorhizobium australicum]|uniref:Uncharacterized protein n=1 Tax=Mesorhizobium australicum TaxID=536018 RepID=A0ACC6SUY0_9HYPH